MIYTVTLNPATDTILNVKGIMGRGKNNRISSKLEDIGGKGTHVSIGLTLLNTENRCLGIAGTKRFNQLNDQLKEYGVNSEFLLLDEYSTRENIVIADESSKGSYLISEVGIELTEEIIDEFFETHLNDLTEKDWVIISGNPSLITKPSVFRYFLGELEGTGCSIVVDASGENLLAAFERQIELIKPNQYEFSEIVGKDVQSPEECIEAYYNHLNYFKHINYVSVSLGREGSVLLSKEEGYKFIPPKVRTVNDTGAGDAYLSGLVYALEKGKTIIEMGRLATAVGAAKVEEIRSSGFNVEKVNRLMDLVKVEEIGGNYAIS